MIYSSRVKAAVELAFKCHDGQVDKGGYPYIMHPLHLAEQMDDEDSCIVALLHDVAEDSAVTCNDLLSYGFSERQVDAIRALTHGKEVPYDDYIRDQVMKNELAVKVKKADIIHNMNLFRMGSISEKDIERLNKKYLPAFELLSRRNCHA